MNGKLGEPSCFPCLFTEFFYMNKYSLKDIYIVYSLENTPDFVDIIARIKRDISDAVQHLDHVVDVHYLQVNKNDFLGSFKTISRLMYSEKNKNVVTDLTAGHKIISYIMFYAHLHTSHLFEGKSMLVYIHQDKVPMRFPRVYVRRVNTDVEGMLRRVHKYYLNPSYKEDDEGKMHKVKLTTYLKEYYPRSTTHRYRTELKKMGLLTLNDALSQEGEMYLFILQLQDGGSTRD